MSRKICFINQWGLSAICTHVYLECKDCPDKPEHEYPYMAWSKPMRLNPCEHAFYPKDILGIYCRKLSKKGDGLVACDGIINGCKEYEEKEWVKG